MDPDAPADEEQKPASFRGRLHLESFMHKPDTQQPSLNSPPRRSPRRLASQNTSTGPSQTHSPSPTPLKRKTPAVSPAKGDPSGPASPTPSSASSTSTTKRRRRPNSTYQPPSVYAHLPPLPDAIDPNLLILFVGLNPGIQTATTGHAYAHPSNLFWKLLHSSGLTPDRVVPATEDRKLPERYSMGFTNIVSRPSRNGAELSKAEMDEGVAALEEKARRWRPEVMCIVGKSIWESIFRVRKGRGLRKGEFSYGWQGDDENMGLEEGHGEEDAWSGSRVFVATSTSGLAATLSPAEKQEIWNELGGWCTRRRREREAAGQDDDDS